MFKSFQDWDKTVKSVVLDSEFVASLIKALDRQELIELSFTHLTDKKRYYAIRQLGYDHEIAMTCSYFGDFEDGFKVVENALNCPFCGSPDCPANCDFNTNNSRSLNSVSKSLVAVLNV